ncbi:hypothetical protein [Pseudoduganella albidiflava]|uniref:Uncharacterized protein n=2 Tax=Pseudoduganella albidiflava TaxID=321983 RepID=A0ABX5RTX6_9BURK|nr:hypothetical protein [Pseudoduganella albidiflava]QBI01446.1 hypothetical protein EYF70_11745 [Pseudoduganella albidiflava]
MMKRQARRNSDMEAVVRQGLVVDAQRGSANAWVYMAAQGVPRSVITRVLSAPDNRRDGDRFAVESARFPMPAVRTRAPRHAH